MFKWAITGKTSKKGEPMLKIVTETRQRTYVNVMPDGEERLSTGHEIIKEIGVTQEGSKQWQLQSQQ